MFISGSEIAMAILLTIICIVGIIILPYWLVPSDPFPKPSGQWQVGTSNINWDSSNHSGILAKVWYPTNETTGIQGSYIDKLGGKFSSNIVVNLLIRLIFSRIFLGHIKTPAIIDATPSQHPGGFPVILFSPGFLGVNFLNTFYGLEFASHGFIVIGINHPGSCMSTILADGSQIGIEKGVLEGFDRPELLMSQVTIDRANELLMVLDKVISTNSDVNSLLYQSINVDRIFAAGHSAGGSASFAACGTERRISRSVNFDGFFYMNEIDINPNKEFLLIQPDRENYVSKGGKSQIKFDLMMEKDRTRINILANNQNFHRLVLQLATHVSFSDLPLIINPSLTKPINLFGKADELDLLLKTSAVTIDFFNK
jgi:dienelactone hydrolase